MGEKKEKEGKKKGNPLKLIIIIIIAIAVVGGGAFAGYMFATKQSAKATSALTTTQQIEESTYQFDEFLVNLADASGQRYLKITIYLGYDKNNKDLATELDSKKPILRDAINTILRSKQAADFSAKGTDNVKKQILESVNKYLSKGQAINVYFYDILIQ